MLYIYIQRERENYMYVYQLYIYIYIHILSPTLASATRALPVPGGPNNGPGTA